MFEYVEFGTENAPGGTVTIWVSRMLDDPGWDSFVAGIDGGQYEQTSWWAQIKEQEKWPECLRVILTQSEEIIGGFQLMLRTKPYIGTIGYISKGPLLLKGREDFNDILFVAVKKCMKKEHIKFLIIQAPDKHEALSPFFSNNALRIYYPKIYPISATAIDLDRDAADILKDMRRTKRQEINKGLKEGVKVREGGEEDLDILFEFMLETCKRQNTPPRPSNVEYFYNAWDMLHPLGHINLFISEYNGESISALLNICFGGVVYPWKFGWSGRHRKVKANPVLYWETMNWAKAHDYHTLYFYEVERIYTSSEFKVGFGGEFRLLPEAHVYILNPFIRFVYTLIFSWVYAEKQSRLGILEKIKRKVKAYLNRIQ